MPRQTNGISYTPQWNFVGAGDTSTLQTYNSLNSTYSTMLTEPLADLRYKLYGLAIASPEVITTNTKYNAFPTITKLDTGALFVAYRESTSHVSNDAVAIGKISLDNGQTWGSPISILSEVGWSISPTALKTLANGDVMMIFARDDGPGGNSSARSVLLDNTGTPITSPVTLGGGYTGFYANFGQIVQLANDDILVTTYGIESGTVKVKVHISTDNGATWSVLATLASVATVDFSQAYTESSLILMPSGNIVVSVRNDATGDIYFAKSIDDGATWSALTAGFKGFSAQALALMGDKLVVGYGFSILQPIPITTSGRQMGIRYSEDEGATFSEVASVSAYYDNRGYMYSGFINISDYLGYVYAIESSSTVADVLFKYINNEQSLAPIDMFNTEGLVNTGDEFITGNIWFEAETGDRHIAVNNTAYEDKLVVAGGRYDVINDGGAINLFGRAHATKAGWAQVNISSIAGSKFAVNNESLGAGNDVFTVDRSGNMVANGALNLSGSITSGATVPIQGTQTTGTIYGQFNNTGNQFLFGLENSTGTNFGAPAYSSNLYTTGNVAMNFWTNGVNRFNISGSGVVNIPNLTASQLVATDASKNLVSAGAIPTSGLYTPAISGTTNVSSSTANANTIYTRVGGMVRVDGSVLITPTAAAYTEFELSLPVASNFTSSEQVKGVVMGDSSGQTTTFGGFSIYTNSTTDKVVIAFPSNNTVSNLINFSFTYQVL